MDSGCGRYKGGKVFFLKSKVEAYKAKLVKQFGDVPIYQDDGYGARGAKKKLDA